MAAPATAPAQASEYTSTTRLARVKELWIADKANREEIGRLLYDERAERLSVGGAGNRTGFHQWLRDAGIPKQSAYRRIAEYEISIGKRAPEDDYDKPVPSGTSSCAVQAEPPSEPPLTVEPAPIQLKAGMRMSYQGVIYELAAEDIKTNTIRWRNIITLDLFEIMNERKRTKYERENRASGKVLGLAPVSEDGVLLRTKVLHAEGQIREWEKI
jgi:hypothetical protein